MQRSEPTYCRDCQNVESGTRKQPPYRWRCLKHPRLEGFGFVTPDLWDDEPPFLRCVDVNGGACVLFERLLPGQMTLGVK